jgi:protein-tyrosine phosphatase
VHAAISNGGRVLLHCRMALSRSPCVAAAYRMWAAQTPLTVADALLQVRAEWPRTAPCDADLALLVELELELAVEPRARCSGPTDDLCCSAWCSTLVCRCE